MSSSLQDPKSPQLARNTSGRSQAERNASKSLSDKIGLVIALITGVLLIVMLPLLFMLVK